MNSTLHPLACSNCGAVGTYIDDSMDYNFAKYSDCGYVAHEINFQLTEGETLEFRSGVLHVLVPEH